MTSSRAHGTAAPVIKVEPVLTRTLAQNGTQGLRKLEGVVNAAV